MQSTLPWLRRCARCAMATALFGSALTGCHSNGNTAGSKLPVVPADSRALPGSVNSADAPEAPRVQTGPDAVTSFRDPETGVSFRYPSSWRPLEAGGPVDAPSFTAAVGPPRGTQAFLAAGTPLARTDLLGISFAWTVKPKMDAAACARMATDALPMGTELSPETIHGVQFHRGTGGDNGMCHHASATLDTAWREGSCYFFERDLETTCPNINTPGADAALTGTERAKLQGLLDGVMDSVVLR